MTDGTAVPTASPIHRASDLAQAARIAIRAPDAPGTARSVARVTACALWGLETALVTVEVDVANGLPAFVVVGLPDAAVRRTAASWGAAA